MAIDTSQWPTKDDARRELGGLSLSQLNNLIKARRLQVWMRKREGQPPIGVINPEDLAREVAQRQNAAQRAFIPAATAIVESPTKLPAETRPRIDRRMLIAAAAPIPLWLEMDEAVVFSGLGESFLRELIASAVIRKGKGPKGTLVLCRADIERYSAG